MADNYFAHNINIKEHDLTVLAVNLNSRTINSDDLLKVARDVFTEISPYLKERQRVLYLRDIKDYAVNDELPGGDAFIPQELNVAVPQWPTSRRALSATLAHEMHHWARIDAGLYGGLCSLGECVVSEGLASHYETVRSGYEPPYCQDKISQEVWKPLLEAWDDVDYDYRTWRLDGQFGKWPMYTAGYILSREYFKGEFDLEESFLDLNARFKALVKSRVT